MERLNKAFDFVQHQIKKNIDYRIKEYAPTHKVNYEIGSHALVFNPMRKSGESGKLKRGWSLPFVVIRKLNDVSYELESLPWANPKFKICRSLTHMKPYIGPTEFKNVRKRYNPRDFCQNINLN